MKIKLNEEGVIRLVLVLNIPLFIYSYYSVFHHWWSPGYIGFDKITFIPNFILLWTEVLFEKVWDNPFISSNIHSNFVWSLLVCLVVDVILWICYLLFKWIRDGFNGKRY